MPKQCQDAYFVQFNLFPEMLSYHEDLRRRSRWVHTSVKSLEVAPLDKTAPLFSDHTGFDAEVTEDAIADTADHLGLAVKVDGRWFPLRDTSYPSLLDRAKINGTALPKLSREKLSGVLNTCLPLHKSEALMLIRDEKVSAAHSGDTRDYSVLEIDQLLDSLQAKVDERFPGNVFTAGYSDHAITSASWSLPGQKRELLDTYSKLLAAQGKKRPGILGTDGTIRTGLYQRECAAFGLEAAVPDRESQTLVMSIIYDEIKQGEKGSRDKFAHIDRAIRGLGCDCAILACTELSVFSTYHPLPPFYVDAMMVLAERAVEACGYPLRNI